MDSAMLVIGYSMFFALGVLLCIIGLIGIINTTQWKYLSFKRLIWEVPILFMGIALIYIVLNN